MKRGSLPTRVSRLEATGAGDCPVCQGHSGHGGFFVEQADGVCRDHNGRALPDGPDEWSCAGCGRTYERPVVVICVVGRSKGLRAGA